MAAVHGSLVEQTFFLEFKACDAILLDRLNVLTVPARSLAGWSRSKTGSL
jgi:hypothetical protein